MQTSLLFLSTDMQQVLLLVLDLSNLGKIAIQDVTFSSCPAKGRPLKAMRNN